MKSKILFISLAVVLALSFGLVGCTGDPIIEPPDAIQVGLVRDTDGALSVFECGYGGSAYRYFVDEINSGGGIDMSTYGEPLDIEITLREFDPLDWPTLTDETDKLIDVDEVHFIWGGPGTDCVFTQSLLCNSAAVPLITLEGGASSMINDGDIDGWPYVWVTLSFSNWNQISVLWDIIDAAETEDPKAWVTRIGGPGETHGLEYLEETESVFWAGNVTDDGAHQYWPPMSPAEADVIVENAKTALGTPSDPNYHVACFFTYPWQVFSLMSAVVADGAFNPPAMIFGPGANGEEFGIVYGTNCTGVMSFVVAVPSQSAALADMYAGIADQVELDWADSSLPACTQPVYMTEGEGMLDYWGHPCYIAGLEIWAAAVEDVGHLDAGYAADFNDAMKAYTESSPCPTVLGDTWFTVFGGGYGGGILAHECHPGEIAQWQGDPVVYEVVGGNDPTSALTYPMTDLWEYLTP